MSSRKSLVKNITVCQESAMDVINETCLCKQKIANKLGIPSGTFHYLASNNKKVDEIELLIHDKGKKLQRVISSSVGLAGKIRKVQTDIGIPISKIARHIGITQQALSEAVRFDRIPTERGEMIVELLEAWANQLRNFKANRLHS